MFCKINSAEIWWLGRFLYHLFADNACIHACASLFFVEKQLCDRSSCIKKEFNCSVKIKYVHTFELMLGYTWWADCHHGAFFKDNRIYRSTRAVFFFTTNVCARTETQLVHTCLHKMCPPVFFEQEVLRVLAELNENEITAITTRDFPSSLSAVIICQLSKINNPH